MTGDSYSRPGVGRLLYESILGLAAGFSLGWFAWLITDRLTDDALALWPFAIGGILLGVTIVRWISTRRSGRGWVHALWIPVAALGGLMVLVILALRSLD